MTSPRIEHVNMTVRDPDRAAELMQRLFGWQVRWSGASMNGGRTVHVGSDDQYLALYTPRTAPCDADFAKGHPLNHIGIAVEDLDAAEAKLIAAGLTPFNHDDYAPGRRFYFLDPDGTEFEVISYG